MVKYFQIVSAFCPTCDRKLLQEKGYDNEIKKFVFRCFKCMEVRQKKGG